MNDKQTIIATWERSPYLVEELDSDGDFFLFHIRDAETKELMRTIQIRNVDEAEEFREDLNVDMTFEEWISMSHTLNRFLHKKKVKPHPKLHCPNCGKEPGDIKEYYLMAAEEDYKDASVAVKHNEGTYSKKHNLFLCTTCYTRLGTPRMSEILDTYDSYLSEKEEE